MLSEESRSNYVGVIGTKVRCEQMLRRLSLGLGGFVIDFDNKNNEVVAANARNDNNTSVLDR